MTIKMNEMMDASCRDAFMQHVLVDATFAVHRLHVICIPARCQVNDISVMR